jgi:hypothetical protein
MMKARLLSATTSPLNIAWIRWLHGSMISR